MTKLTPQHLIQAQAQASNASALSARTGADGHAAAAMTSQQASDLSATLTSLQTKIDGLQRTVDDLRQEMQRHEADAVRPLSLATSSPAPPPTAAATVAASTAAASDQNWMQSLLDELWTKFQANVTALAAESRQREAQLLGTVQHLESQLGRVAMAESRQQHASDAASLVSAADLMALLSVEPAAITRDLDLVIKQGMQLDVASQGQARWLFRTSRFWRWFTSATSDLIMVSGDLVDDPSHARVSPLSVVCAALTACLVQTQPEAVPLYYFCGQHLKTDDGLGGVQGMLRCLVAKLVLELQARGRSDLDVDVTDVRALRKMEVSQLCEVFGGLIEKLSDRTTVYCVIDGISCFERSEKMEEVFSFAKKLMAMVDSRGRGPVVRVLLTSPFPSSRVSSKLHIDRRMFLSPSRVASEVLSDRSFFADLVPQTQASQKTRWSAVDHVGRRTAVTLDEDGAKAEDYF